MSTKYVAIWEKALKEKKMLPKNTPHHQFFDIEYFGWNNLNILNATKIDAYKKIREPIVPVLYPRTTNKI